MEKEFEFDVLEDQDIQGQDIQDDVLEFECSADSDSIDNNDSNDTDDNDDSNDVVEDRVLKVRLDKWLWAARFYKTRALARAAVEAGYIYYNGERSKPSREIELGAFLRIRQGRIQKTVIVKGLSTRRRSTNEALQLFEETEDSKVAREQTMQEMCAYSREPRSRDYHSSFGSADSSRDRDNGYGHNHNHSHSNSYSNSHNGSHSYSRSNNHNNNQTQQSTFGQSEPVQRRSVRFLRRSFTRQPETNTNPSTSSDNFSLRRQDRQSGNNNNGNNSNNGNSRNNSQNSYNHSNSHSNHTSYSNRSNYGGHSSHNNHGYPGSHQSHSGHQGHSGRFGNHGQHNGYNNTYNNGNSNRQYQHQSQHQSQQQPSQHQHQEIRSPFGFMAGQRKHDRQDRYDRPDRQEIRQPTGSRYPEYRQGAPAHSHYSRERGNQTLERGNQTFKNRELPSYPSRTFKSSLEPFEND